MTATAVIGLGSGRSSRLVAKLRGEEGLGLIELLIALLVLNVGIFATLGAFTSAATAINRASRVSTAAAISDKTMECFRDSSYANINWVVGAPCYVATTTGPDGRTYNLSAISLPREPAHHRHLQGEHPGEASHADHHGPGRPQPSARHVQLDVL